MYEYIIQDEHGSVVYVTDNIYHAKQISSVMTMKTNKPYFVDCVLATLCDYTPLTQNTTVPDQQLDPY